MPDELYIIETLTLLDLGSQSDGSPVTAGIPARQFDGMAAGTFIAASGKRVTIKEEDLPVYLANTKRAIAATKDSNGQPVGLPIDLDAHDMRGGAGWIVDVEMAPDRPVLLFTPKWTNEGVDLLASNTRRFFSPTFSLERKYVLGGSMTNWPGSRKIETGEIVLRPVELSLLENQSGIFANLSNLISGAVDLLAARLRQPPQNPKEDDVSDTTPTGPAAAEIEALAQQRADVMLAEALAEQQRTNDIQRAVADLTGNKSTGLPIKDTVLIAALSALPPAQLPDWLSMLGKIQENGLIKFSATGAEGQGSGKQPLPVNIQKRLDDKSLDLTDLSNPALGLGDLSAYDLAKWS